MGRADKLRAKPHERLTLADHAELWAIEHGRKRLPRRGTPAWQRLYETWHAWAFANFSR